jgi:PAS domain S-box-containing protein
MSHLARGSGCEEKVPDGRDEPSEDARLRQAEEALRRSEEKLRVALVAARLGTWERDLRTGELTASEICKTNLGLHPDAPLSFEQLQSMRHPEDVERVTHAIQTAVATGADYDVEYRVLRPDGTVGHVLARGHAIYEDGRPVRMVGVTLDITERERAREALECSDRRQKFLLALNDRLRLIEDPAAVMATASAMIGQHFTINRVGYGEVDPTRQVVAVERDWTDGTIPSVAGRHMLAAFGAAAIAELEQGRTLRVEDVRSDPRTADPMVAAAYAAIQTRAVLAVPLIKNGRLAAVLFLHASRPRAWSNEESALVEDVAERTRSAVERARAESDLRRSEQRLRLSQEAGGVGLWDWDLASGEIHWSGKLQDILGVAAGERGDLLTWIEIVHRDDRALADEAANRAIAGERPLDVEFRVVRPCDGQVVWLASRGEVVHGSDGAPERLVGVNFDVTARRHAEQSLRESEERLRLAQRAARIGTFDWHLPTGRVTWTPEEERLFGLEPGTFEGTIEGWRSRIHPDDRASVEGALAAAMANRDREVDFAFRNVLPDGSVRHVGGSGAILYAPDGSPLRVVGVNIDVTERVVAQTRQNLLIRELHHRVKNTLATVQAIVGSTARSASSIDEFYQAFVGRIVSLAQTHNLLTEDFWQKASLEQLLKNELGPYEDGSGARVVLDGADVDLPSEAAVPIGMAIHELTTNAVKHGAFAAPGGRIAVAWNVVPENSRPVLRFTWTERGGPPVRPPARQGFGSRLLQRVLGSQLQADVHMEFDPEGLRFAMAMPLAPEPAAPTRSAVDDR